MSIPTNEIALTSRKSLKQLKKLASELSTAIANAHDIYQTLETTLAELERQGLIHGKGYWRERKYFYVYSPAQQGKRRVFRYVGCDPEKIRTIQASMHRAIEYDELVAQIARMEIFSEQCSRNLTDVLRTLRDFGATNSSSALLRHIDTQPVAESRINIHNRPT